MPIEHQPQETWAGGQHLLGGKDSVRTHHWIAKPWNWQSDEFLPAAMPSSAIKAATFIPKLLHDAKNMRRFIGLLKPLPNKNVDIMKKTPSREKIEVTLSVIARALTWLGVASIAMSDDC